ncbi:MAG: ABC transporter ATP-binding protein [Nitrospiraceae bacterium]|nr:ABC transporter ATP-binding protein [Nitrospiraceae bacterium]
MPLIELKDITKAYTLGESRRVDVLRGVSIDVEKGEFIAIMGPSGSGKSTLLNIIGCLDRPSSGIYLFEGVLVSEKSDEELASIRNGKIGFVFQSFNLIHKFSAMKNVELPLVYAGVRESQRRETAARLLEKVGLSGRAGHKPPELSGGEQQRVAIARALANNPAIILADEPTGNLDSKSGAEVMDIFLSLHRQGATVVMVTHEPRLAEMAGRIIHIRDGEVA